MKAITLSLLAFVMVTSANTATAQQSGDEIINKHIEATGGEKNWSKINSIKLSGSMSIQGMDIPTTRTTINNKAMRMDLTVMGMEGYIILTQKEGWMYMPFQPGMEEVKPVPEEQVKQSQSQLNIKHTLLADKSQIAKAVYSGMDTINNAPCVKVAVTGKDGNEVTAYFDTKTYYMVRTETKIKVKDEEQEIAMSFSNFQKQPEGITIPLTESNPMMGGDVVYKSVEINKPISDEVFKPSKPKK